MKTPGVFDAVISGSLELCNIKERERGIAVEKQSEREMAILHRRFGL